MSLSARRAIGDALLFTGGVMILVLALVATDGRVRDRASRLVGGGPPLVGVADVGTQVSDLMATAIHVTRVWTGTHVYLSIFAVTALLLVLAVLRL